MTETKRFVSLTCLAALLATSGPLAAQTAKEQRSSRAAAYYHYSMGHLYAELAGAYGNRGDYANRAIEHYKEAIKADPTAGFLSDELSDLYIQSGQLRAAVTESEESLKRNPDDLNARRILGRIYTRLIGDAQQNRINEEMLRKAIEQYTRISEKDPADRDSWLMLGRLQKVAQNSVEAEAAYKKVLELDPENEDAMTGLAMVYSDVGDTDAATELLSKVAEKNPNFRTLTTLASIYEQMRNYSLAADTLKRTLPLAQNNPELKKALAQNLVMADRLDEALEVYTELSQEEPKDTHNYLRISQIYQRKRNFEKAREASRKARELEPNNIEIRYNEVNLLDAEGKVQDAITALRELIDATEKRNYNLSEKSSRAVLLERLAILHRSAEQFQEAADTFRRIADLDSDLGARAAAQIIDTYRIGKKFKEAEQEAQAALKQYPDDRILTSVHASLLADLGRSEKAVAEAKKLFDGRNDREVHLTLAQIYEKAKDYASMAKSIDEAEKLSDSPEEKESVHFMRGAMFEKMKRFDDSEAEFRKALAINPDNAGALNYLGYMLADRNVRLAEAHEMISKALEHDPHNGAYLDSLGWVYYRMGRLEEAEKYLLLAIARVSRDPTVHDHLGDVYAKQGRLKEAIAQWEIAIREWETSSPSETDPAEIAKIQKKLEGAKVRLARENSGTTQQ